MSQWFDVPVPHGAPSAVVAIPARDEEARLEACLRALGGQVDLGGRPLSVRAFGVLLLLNNIRDNTAGLAAALRPSLPFPMKIVEIDLPPALANAGGARQLAMDAAAEWLERGGATDGHVLTTDADSAVAPDWIARQFAAFAEGADAVAGYVEPDARELGRLPGLLHQRLAEEARYALLLAELRARLAPKPWDPWPSHGMASGASLGMRLGWYRRVTDRPLPASSEDRALLQRLVAAGARVRHCPWTRVTTSCRFAGRAEGGMAATLRRRLFADDAPGDDALAPVRDVLSGEALPGRERRRLKLSELPAEIAIAERLLAELRGGAKWHQPDGASVWSERPADSGVCAQTIGGATADALPA